MTLETEALHDLGLVAERHSWNDEMKSGTFQDPNILKLYRENRDSELWRSTREVEKLCEYIVYLENVIGEKNE